MRRHHSLRWTLLIAMLAVTLIPLAVAGVALIADAETRLRHAALNDAAHAGELAQTVLDERGQRLVASAQAIALDSGMRQAVLDRDHAALLALTRPQMARLGGLTVTVVDTESTILVRAYDPDRFGEKATTKGQFIALREGRPLWSTEEGLVRGLAVRGYGPVESDGRVIGAVIVTQNLDREFLTSLQQRTGLPKFAILADGTPLGATLAPSLLNALRSTNSTYTGFGEVDGREQAIAAWGLTDPEGEPAGVLGIVFPLTTLEQAQIALRRRAFGAGFIALVAAVSLAWMLSGRLLEPLQRITTAARLITDGHAAVIKPTDSRNEVGDLSRSLSTMVETLSARTREVEDLNKTLRAGEEFLTHIFETMTDVVLVFDRGGRIAMTNAAGEHILGIGRDQIVGTSFDAPGWKRLTLAGEPMPVDEHPLVQVRATGQPIRDAEFIVERPDGRRVMVCMNAAPLRSSGDGFAGMVALVSDITARKEAEARLAHTLEQLAVQYREAERARGELRAVLDATSEAIILVAPDRRFVAVNRPFTDLFGIAAEDVLGHRFDDLQPLVKRAFADPQAFAAWVAGPAFDTEHPFTAVMAQRWPDQRELEFFSTPVRDGEARYLGRLYAVRDVTRERAIDRMKSEFVSLAAHELRTPLTSIKGYTDLLSDGEVGELSDVQQEFIGIVKGNADRLMALVNDLLDVTRIEAGGIELRRGPLQLARVLEAVAGTLRPQLEAKDQHLTLTVPADLPLVSADPDRVTQIVTNLLSNAHKYTPRGGTITITAQPCGNQVQVDVRDTGIGLSPDEQARLFTKFYRAQNQATQEAGGTGLGLTITRSLVELHGGEMHVTSARGAGSTFSFTLPADDGVVATHPLRMAGVEG